jgi:excinuclease UvrABC nuclease subunit
MLLKEFKSITRIKEASVETLSPVVGKTAAEIIVEYYLKGSADGE